MKISLLNETLKDVRDIKNPQTRLNILMPIAASVVLFAFCVRLFFLIIRSDGSTSAEQKEKIRQLEERNEKNVAFYLANIDKERKRTDSLQALRYDESQARINEYKSLLKTAESVKTKIRTLKKVQ